MTMRDYAALLARRKGLIIVPTLVAVAAALALSWVQSPSYASSAEVLVQPQSTGALYEVGPGLASSGRAIDTEVEVMEGDAVRSRVQDDLGLDEPPPPATATAIDNTDVIRVEVAADDPGSAQLLADAYATAYTDLRRERAVEELLTASVEVQEQIDELQARIDELPEDDPGVEPLLAQMATLNQTLDQLQVDSSLRTGGVSIVEPAERPSDPVEPRPARNALFAGLAGLLLGLAAVFVVEYFDTSVTSAADLARITPVPVLAAVPVARPSDRRPVALSDPDSPAGEIYRTLRTNLGLLGVDHPLTVIQITSSVAGEGKTTTAGNLAVMCARAGGRTLVVDADLRRPQLHTSFGIADHPGLADVLLGGEVADAITTVALTPDASLDVLPCGALPPNPSEMLSGQRMRTLLAELAGRYDHVILDSPPILPVADSLTLTAASDGVLVVVEAGRTTASTVRNCLQRLEGIRAPVVGLVLNRAHVARGDYGYEAYVAGRDRSSRQGGPAERPAPGSPLPPPRPGSAIVPGPLERLAPPHHVAERPSMEVEA